MKSRMLILGGGGYLGRYTAQAALAAGWQVQALARSVADRDMLDALGAQALVGDVRDAAAWQEAARGTDVLIDLVQPRLPARLTPAGIARIAALRLQLTEVVLTVLAALPGAQRPRLLSVSGMDDLAPDSAGRVAADSALRQRPQGFGRIGVAVRRQIESAIADAMVAGDLRASFVYLGHVYGPGKGFADKVFPALARGRFPVIGRGENRLALVHVEDAARALVHIAGQDRSAASCLSYVVADGAQTTQRAFLQQAAALLGAPPPRRVPVWLANWLAGRVMVHELTADLQPDAGALLATGFRFRYASCREGLPPTLRALGYHIAAETEVGYA